MLTVADIMSTNVFTVRSSAKVTQAIALMQKNNVRSLIVEKAVEGGTHGIVTERDIVYKVMAESTDPLHTMVCEIMQNPCVVLESKLGLLDTVKRFRDTGIQQAPVIESGRLVGIVSISDIIAKTDVTALELPEDWAETVETALRHKRLCWSDECELEEKSKTALEVLEELRPKTLEPSSRVRSSL
ncbi:MAG: CBS domain-containing protein [Phormidesmis sp.]